MHTNREGKEREKRKVKSGLHTYHSTKYNKWKITQDVQNEKYINWNKIRAVHRKVEQIRKNNTKLQKKEEARHGGNTTEPPTKNYNLFFYILIHLM